MLRLVANQMLKWLVTAQLIVINLNILSVTIQSGLITQINWYEVSSKSKPVLEIAKAVRIWSTEEIFFLLTQSMKFTSAMNPLLKIPVIRSTPMKTASTLCVTATAPIAYNRMPQVKYHRQDFFLQSHKPLYVYYYWKHSNILPLKFLSIPSNSTL